MTDPQPAEPVAVTVQVPVTGDDAPIEVTVILTARRATAPYTVGVDDAGDEEPDLRVPPPPAPSAVVGRGAIAGVRQRQD